MPARLKIRLSDSEKKEFLGLTQNPKTPKRTLKRAEVLRLNNQGWSVKEIALWIGWSESTVRQAIKRWLEEAEKRRAERGIETVIVLDNYSVHKSPQVKQKEKEGQSQG